MRPSQGLRADCSVSLALNSFELGMTSSVLLRCRATSHLAPSSPTSIGGLGQRPNERSPVRYWNGMRWISLRTDDFMASAH